MTPSEVLSRAADLIRDRAAAATDGRWQTLAGDGLSVADSAGRTLVSSSCCGGQCPGYVDRPEDAEWIAALSPALAPLIENVLRQASNAYLIWARGAGPVSSMCRTRSSRGSGRSRRSSRRTAMSDLVQRLLAAIEQLEKAAQAAADTRPGSRHPGRGRRGFVRALAEGYGIREENSDER